MPFKKHPKCNTYRVTIYHLNPHLQRHMCLTYAQNHYKASNLPAKSDHTHTHSHIGLNLHTNCACNTSKDSARNHTEIRKLNNKKTRPNYQIVLSEEEENPWNHIAERRIRRNILHNISSEATSPASTTALNKKPER